MDDRPGRPADELDGRDGRPDRGNDGGGWGSPVPSEYGSLRSTRSGDAPTDGERAPRGRRDQTDAADRWGMGSLRRRLQPTPTTPGDERDGAATGTAAATGTGSATGTAAATGAAGNGSEPSGSAATPAAAARPASQAGPGQRPADRSAPGEPTTVQAAAAEPATARFSAVPAAAAGAATASAAQPTQTTPQPQPLSGGADGYAAAFGAGDQPYGRRRPVRRPVRGRSRATVRHLDVVTVVRVSVIFYLVILIVFVVASLFLWLAADTFGSLPSIEKSVRTLFSLRKFTLHPGAVALYTALAGLVLTVAGTIWNILLAVIYNLIADVVGGVRVELESFTKE